MSEQDAHILDRSDQVILDLLSPKRSPAGAFKVAFGVGGHPIFELRVGPPQGKGPLHSEPISGCGVDQAKCGAPRAMG